MSRLLQLLAQVQVPDSQINIPKTELSQNKVAVASQYFFAIAAGVAVMIIVLAGLKYVLSRGESEAISKAKNTILYAVIGLVICISAFAIIGFIGNRL